MNRRVLFVDDEPNVVEGIKRQLRKSFEVSTSTNPQEALELIKTEPDFAVVVSDMRMPQMSGVEFLTSVKQVKPETVRVMLTGNQDQLTASAAVNQGEVFRFLNKPCDTAALTNVLEQALRQYQLLTAERDLLTRTLQGSLKVLLEALSIAKPGIFGGIDRIERKCSQLAAGLAGVESWEMRAAARLSRMGCLGLSDGALQKIASGEDVSGRERAEYEGHPQAGAKLVGEIPRLERVAEIILYQNKNFDGSGFPEDSRRGTELPMGARVLRLVLAYDELQTRGSSDSQAIKVLRTRAAHFDPDLLERFAEHCPVEAPKIFRVSPNNLPLGCTIAEDVQSTKGILLVCRGQTVTLAVQGHLQKFFELGTLSTEILVSSAN